MSMSGLSGLGSDTGRRADEIPGDTEFQKLHAHLTAHGFTAVHRQAALGSAVAGRSRRQIARALAVWLRSRPHA
jgi:hypothetical protein